MRVLCFVVDKDRKKRSTSGNKSSGKHRGIPRSSIDIEMFDDSDEESDSASTAADSTTSSNQVEQLLAPSLFDGSSGYCGSVSAGPSPLTGHPSLYSPVPAPASGGPGLGPFTTAGQPFPGLHPPTVGEPTIAGPSSIPLSAPTPTYPLYGNLLDFLSAPQATNYLDTSPTLPPLTLDSGAFPYGFTALPTESPCTQWTTPGWVNQGLSVGQNNNPFSFNGVDTMVSGIPLWNANVPQTFDYVPQPTTAYPTSAFPSPITPTPVPVVPEQPTNNANDRKCNPPKPQAATSTSAAASSDKGPLLDDVQKTLNDVSSRQPGADGKSLQEKLVKMRCIDMWFSEDSQT